MGIEARLVADLKAAMKAGRRTEAEVIKYLRYVIARARDDRDRGPLSELEVLQVIWKHAQTVREALDIAADVDRDDHADGAIGELEVIARYLPPPLTESELRAMAERVVGELGAVRPPGVGEVMHALIPALGGRIELGRAHAVVSALLKDGGDGERR